MYMRGQFDTVFNIAPNFSIFKIILDYLQIFLLFFKITSFVYNIILSFILPRLYFGGDFFVKNVRHTVKRII